MQVNMHEAKSQLSRLGELAWQGEEVVITKAGKPYLALSPYRSPTGKRKFGQWKGKVWIAPDFDETSSKPSRASTPRPRTGSGRRRRDPHAGGQALNAATRAGG